MGGGHLTWDGASKTYIQEACKCNVCGKEREATLLLVRRLASAVTILMRARDGSALPLGAWETYERWVMEAVALTDKLPPEFQLVKRSEGDAVE